MKKKHKLLLIILIAFFAFIWYVFDVHLIIGQTIKRPGDSLIWNGVRYESTVAGGYTEGEPIAKTFKADEVKEVEQDKTHTFVVYRSFLDQTLFVREDYNIPTFGKITTASWNNELIEDERFFNTISIIMEQATTDFEYETDDIGEYEKDGSQMRRLYVGYEDCPLATEFVGYMGTVDGKWYITTEIDYSYNEPGTVWCYTIPEQFIPVIEGFYR